MRLLFVIAILFVSSCGDATAPNSGGEPVGTSITEEQFEASRVEAGSLVTGTVADWHAASEEAKTTYSIASAMPLLSGGGTAEQRGALGAAFRRCMDAEVARSAPTALLGDVSYTCAMAFQNRTQR